MPSTVQRRALRSTVAGLGALATILAATVPAVAAAPSAAPAGHPAGKGGACVRTLDAGTSTLGVAFEGETYDVRVHVPDAPDHRALPLVLDLHGSNNNATLQAQISGLEQVADAEDVIVATPTGDLAFEHTLPDGNWAWNVPDVPLTSGTFPPADARDDVAFLRAVVDQVDGAGCVDDRRVYATGFSGGGRMASALACEASDVFAAIAPVAGLRAGRPDPADLSRPEAGTCEPENPVAVMTFHGTADQVNPYQGNGDPRWGYTTQLAAHEWADINDCRVGPRSVAVSDEVTRYAWTKCDEHADVVLYEVADAGHTWPGSDLDMGPLGRTTQDIDATALMWDFFSSHQRRG
ncbi:PHB depolymerase family esterase [Isoptericola hypogeus]|uniref:PHB depolymerase family esterase n=1 Tax=Isoptericola hypogeus TaxID=300179 RepID=A0ABN2JH59_9MICO